MEQPSIWPSPAIRIARRARRYTICPCIDWAEGRCGVNSRGVPAEKATTISVEAESPSTWIERFAIPLAASSMEAQPIALVVVLLTLMVAGTKATPPLGAAGIALIALGLLWWAMLVERVIRRSIKGKRATWLHFLGWLAAFAVVIGPRLPSLNKGEDIF